MNMKPRTILKLNARMPDSTGNELTNTLSEAATSSSISENTSINHLRSNRWKSNRASQNIPRNQNSEHKDHVLDTSVKRTAFSGTRQCISYRTKSEQTVKMECSDDTIWLSRSFQEHAEHLSISTINQSETSYKQNDVVNMSYHPDLTSTFKDQGATKSVDIKTRRGQKQDLHSLQIINKKNHGEIKAMKDHSHVDIQKGFSHKSGKQPLKPAMYMSSVNTSTSRSMHDVPAKEHSRSKSSSVTKCRSSHLSSEGQKKEESLTRVYKNNKEESIAIKCHKQNQSRESASHQTQIVSSATYCILKSMSTNAQRTGQEHLISTTTKSKNNKCSCRSIVPTQRHGSLAQPPTCNICVPPKHSGKPLPQNEIKLDNAQTIISKSFTQNRFKGSRSPAKSTTCGENRTETISKLNSGKIANSASSLCRSDHDLLRAKQCELHNEIKLRELLCSAEHAKVSTNNQLRNIKQRTSASPRQTQTSKIRHFNSLKRNESTSNTEIETSDKEQLQRLNSKSPMVDRKRDCSETVEYCQAKVRNINLASDKNQTVQTVFTRQTRSANSGLFKRVGHCIPNQSVTSCKKLTDQEVGNPAKNIGSAKLNTFSGLTGLTDLKTSVVSPCETNLPGSSLINDNLNICDVSQAAAYIKSEDLLPVVCVYWRKRDDLLQQNERQERKCRHCIVSVDQGLRVLNKIIMDTSSKNMEYILSQCTRGEPQIPAKIYNSWGKKQSELVSEMHFMLTPRVNMQPSQLAFPDKGTHVSQLKESETVASLRYDQKYSDSANYTSGLSSSLCRKKRPLCEGTFQTYETPAEYILNSQYSKGSKIPASTWYFVSNKIISFFLSSRIKNRVPILHAIASMLESRVTGEDNKIICHENAQDVDDFVAQQQGLTDVFLPSQHFKPAIIAYLEYFLQKKRYNSSEELSNIATTSAAVSSWTDQATAENHVMTRINSDANENKSRFKAGFNSLISGENHLVNCDEILRNTIADKEITERDWLDPETAQRVVSLDDEITDDREDEVCFHFAPRVELDKNFQKSKHANCIALKQQFQLADTTSTVHLKDLPLGIGEGNTVTETSTIKEDNPFYRNLYMSSHSHSNADVAENIESNKEYVRHEQLSSNDICSTSNFHLSFEYAASILRAKFLGSIDFKQHPHLMWLIRISGNHQASHLVKSEPRSSTLILDHQMDIENLSVQGQLSEKADLVKQIQVCIESIHETNGHNNDNSPVKISIDKEAMGYLTTDRFLNNAISAKTVRIDQDKRTHTVKITNKLSSSALTPIGVMEESQSNTESEG